MGENTKVEWADHSFNPWAGCQKVSPGCDHCYAEGWSKRSGLVEWGPHGSRRRTSPANWRKPLKWDAEANAAGVRKRVFCASLADVFDNHGSITSGWRGDLWHLIARTPNLDWLILTKRPQNIAKMLPDGYGAPAWGDGWPNVWLGTTVENQVEAERRIPRLLRVSAKVHFLSCDPLLGRLDLTAIPYGNPIGNVPSYMNALSGRIWMPKGTPDWTTNPRATAGDRTYVDLCRRLRWIIAGGESGPGARPMHPDLARGLRDQCQAAEVPFFFKQWGEWAPRYDGVGREYVLRVGRKAAGRLLDGREWNEVPP